MKNVDNTPMFCLLLSNVYTESRTFEPEGRRCTSWEEAQPGLLTQAGQRDIPYNMTSCSIYKLREEEGRGHLELWHFSSQVTIMHGGMQLFSVFFSGTIKLHFSRVNSGFLW